MTSHAVQQQLDQHEHEFNFTLDPESIVSVSDEEQIASRMDALTITKNDVAFGSDIDEDEDLDLDVELEERAEETRLRYARLQARGRAAELAYNNRLQREREHTNAHERSRSHSKSRSRPSTPMLGALFKRDNFGMSITRSQSPPLNSVPEKSSRRPSMTNLFKFKPISRSSSSKSIQISSASSSQPTSPFPSPLTPLSPLPAFFFSPKSRRKTMNYSGEDNIEVAALSGPNPGFGAPLTRTTRRPSPTRPTTLPDDIHSDISTTTVRSKRRKSSHGTHVHTFSLNAHRRRESSPLGRTENFTVPASGPHLVEGSALSLVVDAE